MEKDKKNCTTIFLLPGIGHLRQDLLPYGFIAAYLDDIHHSVHYEESIYLLFKPEDTVRFQEFLEEEYQRSKLILEDYDYEGGYVVVVYKFDKAYISEYQLFLQGKYSEFSDEYIAHFPSEVWIIEDGIETLRRSLQYHIFTRSDEIKRYWEKKVGESLPEGMELWSKPDMSKEVLDIELYKKEE